MVLLVAATEIELCGHEGLVCGIGPVESAAATARVLALQRPDGVLHVGLAGASGIEPGSLVIGAEAVYADLGAAIPVVDSSTPDPLLVTAIRAVLPAAPFVPIRTSAAVSGAGSALSVADRAVEAMEGFGVLRACELAGVPAVEVRAIANAIGEDDRSLWRIDDAIASLARALPRLLSAVGDDSG